ncbi:MAG: ABC transporter ATP-binding protein [Anaeroplasmataceae bacterium]
MAPLKGKITKDFDKKKTLKRLMSYLFKYYKLRLILVIICIIFTGIGSMAASIFMQRIIDDVIYKGIQTSFPEVKNTLIMLISTLGSIYVVAIISSFIYTQLLAIITQGFLARIRMDMFGKMEGLPISYFDRHAHGEIMSTYTNDVDSIRQLISQSLPQIFNTLFTVITLFVIMLYYSLYLTLVAVVAVIFILFATKKIGGGSAKYFIRQQASIAKCEGFIEEMMNGQKVVKVFCHEEEAKKDFDKLNDALYNDAYNANAYANMLGPIIHNIGNILYVVVAVVGVVLYLLNVKNIGISSIGGIEALSIGTVVTFLGMSRQFANSFNQISQQINSVVMGLAGADRIFELMDQVPEVDDGYVTLVNAIEDEEGNITESEERTGVWAWKHPHQADGTITYTKLRGDIRFFDVDFGYFPEKIVLHDVSIYAKPGHKIAFVGATGAGKTTITNLINRFYDLADGKIRYDGININKIKKSDLRRSIGIVLQDTNLFTGTVRDNIRYGKLDATEEEIIKASKIANAYDFITRLPEGFDTMLSGNGSQLSQGQRQLISIARAAIADAPVMILDEATSSIDTRTELLVQKGMDALMNGRTVFVIAHRLSTVQNSNAIMVLDHGRIIERGTHEDLINAKGTYYQLYTGAFELE